MKHDEGLQRQEKVLRCLSYLPRMMLKLKERENVPEFVLHDLCHPACFNLRKAAYFVDNPDFDCLRGVAGFSQDDLSPEDRDIWSSPEEFSQAMKRSEFNQRVRQIERTSQRRGKISDKELVEEMVERLGLDQPSSCSWDMKYDNYGLLIFEKSANDESIDKYLIDGVCMLSFCPIN